MRNGSKHNTSQLFDFARDSYFERTSRPIYAIVFLLPFIVFYELGTIFINTDLLNQTQVRVVAFVWLQKSLVYLGFGSKLAWAAPPLAVVTILVALQLVSGKRWRFAPGDIWAMAVECVMLAVPLIVLTLFMNSPSNPSRDTGRFTGAAVQTRTMAGPSRLSAAHGGLSQPTNETDSVRPKTQSLLADIVTGIGAGIYEELIFRLILILALMLLFQDVLRFKRTSSIIISVLVSATLFSAHHHIDFLSGQLNQRDLFDWTEFTFRTIAGIYFAVLFAVRGFGITAGTHAFYDIIAVSIRAAFFQQ